MLSLDEAIVQNRTGREVRIRDGTSRDASCIVLAAKMGARCLTRERGGAARRPRVAQAVEKNAHYEHS